MEILLILLVGAGFVAIKFGPTFMREYNKARYPDNRKK
jgi:hypothetical protein